MDWMKLIAAVAAILLLGIPAYKITRGDWENE
jgi:hypothetical protein